jgi:hypothetical protein
MEIKVGDKLTKEEFEKYRNYKSYSSSMDSRMNWIHKIDKDAWFLVKDNIYEVISTWESRIADQDTGYANIHRKESRQFKSYYDQRKH